MIDERAGDGHPYHVFAVVGKGGVGKTTFTHLFARAWMLRGIRPLLIDADPTMSHLARSFGVSVERSIEQIRMDVVRVAARGKAGEKENLARSIDDVVADSTIQAEQFAMLALGQPDTPGCFCPSNSLLRSVIENELDKYPLVIIDCEAGMEQINRTVIRAVDYLILVSDGSLRGLETAENLIGSAKKFTSYRKMGLVLNKIRGPELPFLEKKVDEMGVPLLGVVPDDMELVDLEMRGEPLLNVEPTTAAFRAVEEVFGRIRGSRP
ncbi:MAG: nucleotide-binding protein [Promethearchaeota archaeon]